MFLSIIFWACYYPASLALRPELGRRYQAFDGASIISIVLFYLYFLVCFMEGFSGPHSDLFCMAGVGVLLGLGVRDHGKDRTDRGMEQQIS